MVLSDTYSFITITFKAATENKWAVIAGNVTQAVRGDVQVSNPAAADGWLSNCSNQPADYCSAPRLTFTSIPYGCRLCSRACVQHVHISRETQTCKSFLIYFCRLATTKTSDSWIWLFIIILKVPAVWLLCICRVLLILSVLHLPSVWG